MCPPPRLIISSSPSRRGPDSAFSTWLRSAQCVTTVFFRRDDEPTVVECPECKSARPPAEKENFRGIITHYIYLGDTFVPPKCDSCHTPVGFRRDHRDCDCSQDLENFVHHLIREGDSP